MSFENAKIALLICASTALFSQTASGSIYGTVTDAARKPLAGVQIRLTSANMVQPRIVKTDAKGTFKLPMLPPGSYSFLAIRDGFISVSVSNLRIGQESNIAQAVVMTSIKAAEALVVVEAGLSVIDKSDTKTATNFSASDLQTLPADRGMDGAMDFTAGLVSSSIGGVSFRGSATAGATYTVNGADVKDPVQNQRMGYEFVKDNVEDIQVVLSPLHPRNGHTLGGVNVVTKSGSNDFHGSIRETLSDESWNATSKNARPGVTDDLFRQTDIVLSGPILQDHLWFNIATILVPISGSTATVNSGNYNNYDTTRYNAPAQTPITALEQAFLAGPPASGYLPMWNPQSGIVQSGANIYDASKSGYFEGKLTWAITPDHTIEGTVHHETSSEDHDTNDRPNWIMNLAQTQPRSSDIQFRGINYRGILAADTFLQARYSYTNQRLTHNIGDPGAQGVPVQMVADYVGDNGFHYNRWDVGGTGYNPDPEEHGSQSANLELKHFVEAFGTHELDFGLDYYQARVRTGNQSGAANCQINSVATAYRNPTTGDYLFPVVNWQGSAGQGQSPSGNSGIAPVMWQWLGADGVVKDNDNAIYLADQWTLNSHWNVFMAFREDFYKALDTDGKTKLADTSAPSPRVQVRWDIKGDSVHLLDLSVARFNQDISLGFIGLFATQADSNTVYRGWNGNAASLAGLGPNAPLPAGALQWVDFSQLENPANYGPAYRSQVLSANQQVGKIGAPYTDQIELGYRRTFSDKSWLRLGYVYRETKNQIAIDEPLTTASLFAIPTPQSPNNTGYGFKSYIYNTNALRRVYNDLEMEWEKRIDSIFSVRGLYTWSRTVGNDNGSDATDPVGSTYTNTNPTAMFTGRQVMNAMGLTMNDYSPTGPLVNNQEHRARLSVLAVVPVGKQGQVTYAATLRYESGPNFSAANYAPLNWAALPAAQNPFTGTNLTAFNYPSYTQYYGGRGQYQYNDTMLTDFRISWDIPLGYKKFNAIGDFTITNIFNHCPAEGFLSYDTRFQATSQSPQTQLMANDPSIFGRSFPYSGVNYYNAPRSLSFSAGFKF